VLALSPLRLLLFAFIRWTDLVGVDPAGPSVSRGLTDANTGNLLLHSIIAGAIIRLDLALSTVWP
jgi:hypothetical protein